MAQDENLFILEGFNKATNTCLKSVKKLNTTTQEWVVLPDMTTPRPAFGCVLHRKKIFCFGGLDGDKKAEMLDLESKQTNMESHCGVVRPNDWFGHVRNELKDIEYIVQIK